MRIVIQRVSESSVHINRQLKAQIGNGLMILAGFEENDTEEDIVWMSKKISSLRIFDDDQGVMNLSVCDVKGEILLISQFTLFAKTKKGNRPSYIKAAKPELSIPLYHTFINQLTIESGIQVKSGEFGADMQISLINNGPVTIIIDSKNKE
jgi:D-tyrosyl-tRNA(Tyr) deacylase